MTWSHNDMWMLTADHGGYVKYWQSNMNNVKMFQAHKEAVREARFTPNLHFSLLDLLSCLVDVCANKVASIKARLALCQRSIKFITFDTSCV